MDTQNLQNEVTESVLTAVTEGSIEEQGTVQSEEVETSTVEVKEEVKEEITAVKPQVMETMADYEAHFDDANPWNLVAKYMKQKTNLTVTIEGVVGGGAIAVLEGLRSFIPASRLSLTYVENLETFLNTEVQVRVIEVDQAENKLVLSCREILREQEQAKKKVMIENITVGTITKGVVESLQDYGAFVRLEDGLSGLVHVSQIANRRIKTPKEVLKVGEEVKVKIIGVKEGKISLSIKALEENAEEQVVEKVVLPKAEAIGTNLGDLFKNIKL